MAGITRTIHPVSNVEFGPIERLIPGVDITPEPIGNGNGKPDKLRALRFTDPDGEQHVYLFTEEGRVGLIRQLTGGLVVPSG